MQSICYLISLSWLIARAIWARQRSGMWVPQNAGSAIRAENGQAHQTIQSEAGVGIEIGGARS
jgi:hypothetical protein